MSFPEFVPFAPIKRLARSCFVTEKIDGTNAQVYISDDGVIMAGSRNRWLTVEADNFGFARWVAENATELSKLGPGRHYGEWWGLGIQRGYGLKEKRFSLFNTGRWSDAAVRPACCHVVPVLYGGEFNTQAIDGQLERLRVEGSVASPGFMNPEGIVVFHAQSGGLFKKTLNGDGHKGVAS